MARDRVAKNVGTVPKLLLRMAFLLAIIGNLQHVDRLRVRKKRIAFLGTGFYFYKFLPFTLLAMDFRKKSFCRFELKNEQTFLPPL